MLGKLDEVRHRFGEPAQSYASRLAAHYGCASVQEFLLDFDINSDRLSSGHEAEVIAVAELTGTNVQSLLAATPSTKTGLVRFGSETFSLYYSQRKRIAGCPECLSEDIRETPHLLPEAAAHLRMHWLLSPIMTCEKHSRPLVPLGSILEFAQRYDYALRLDGIAKRLPAMLEPHTRREASDFEKYVFDRLYGRHEDGNWLNALHLNELFGVCANIGQKALGKESGFLKLEESDQHAAYAEGYKIISGGRETLRAFFNELIRTRELKVPIGPATLLGRTYTALLGSRRSWEKYAPILEPLANAIYDVLPYGPGDAPLFDVQITHRRLFNPRQAAKRFGMVPQTLLRYAIANGIGSTRLMLTQYGARKWSVIDADGAEKLFGRPLDQGWRKRLRSQGLSLTGLKALLDAKILVAVEVGEGPATKSMAPLPEGAADKLTKALIDSAELVAELPDGCVKLSLASRCSEGIALLFQGALDGSIWTGRLASEPRLFRALIVRVDEARRIFEWPDRFSVQAAAKLSGLGEALIYAALSSGLVESQMALELRSGQLHPALSKATVEYLKREYIGLRELAGGNPRKAGTLRAKLDVAGVVPAIHRRGSYAYRRSDVAGWLNT